MIRYTNLAGTSKQRRLGAVLQLLGIGWYVALSIVAGILGGRWLDDLLDTGVVFTLIGLALGLTMAFVGMYRMLARVLSEDSNEN